MGHMRIGFLPRSKQWNAIVEQLSLFGGDPTDVHQIADATLSAMRTICSRRMSAIRFCNSIKTKKQSAHIHTLDNEKKRRCRYARN